MNHKYAYVASPYSEGGANKRKRTKRYKQTADFVVWCWRKNFVVYSPIVHWHELAVKYDLPGTEEHWRSQNRTMLMNSGGLWVLKLDGWDTSDGVEQELNWAQDFGLDVSYVDIDGEDTKVDNKVVYLSDVRAAIIQEKTESDGEDS